MKEDNTVNWEKEDFQDIRIINNMMNHTNQTCKTCHWSGYEKGEDWITCGVHIQNFKPNSYCGYWTNPKNPDLLEWFRIRKERLINKMKK